MPSLTGFLAAAGAGLASGDWAPSASVVPRYAPAARKVRRSIVGWESSFIHKSVVSSVIWFKIGGQQSKAGWSGRDQIRDKARHFGNRAGSRNNTGADTANWCRMRELPRRKGFRPA